MKKFKNIKGYVIGGLIGATLMFSVQGFGDEGLTKVLDAYFRTDIKVTLNGKQVDLQNVPIVADGKSYFPLRELANALGLSVNWNADTNTAELTSVTGAVYGGTSVSGSVYGDTSTSTEVGSTTTPSPVPSPNDGTYTQIPKLTPLAVIVGVTYNFPNAPNDLYKDVNGSIFSSMDVESLLRVYFNDYLIDMSSSSKTISLKWDKIFVETNLETDVSTGDGYTVGKYYNDDKSKVFVTSKQKDKESNVYYYKSHPILSLDKLFSTLGMNVTVLVNLDNKTVTYTFNN